MTIILLQQQFQTSDPITPDGGISAGWVLVGALTLIGFLIIFILNNISKNNNDALIAFKEEIKNIHNRINTREDEHEELKDKHTELSTKVLLIEAQHKISSDSQAQKTAELILNKLATLQKDSGRHEDNPMFQ